MKFRFNYLVIPLIAILTAIFGSFFTSANMSWYNSQLLKPALTPPSWVFPLAWTIIFILTAVSALIFWNHQPFTLSVSKIVKRRKLIVILLLINASLNVLWSWLFFKRHLILPALFEMIVLELTTIMVIFIGWKISKLSSLLLLPYVLWVGFAAYLTYLIYQLN